MTILNVFQDPAIRIVSGVFLGFFPLVLSILLVASDGIETIFGYITFITVVVVCLAIITCSIMGWIFPQPVHVLCTIEDDITILLKDINKYTLKNIDGKIYEFIINDKELANEFLTNFK